MGPSCPQVQNGPHHLFPKIYPSLITLQSSLVPKLETPASFWNPPCPSAFPSPADSAPIYLSNHSFSPYLPPCAQLRPLLRAFEHKPPIHPHIIHLTHTPATPPPSQLSTNYLLTIRPLHPLFHLFTHPLTNLPPIFTEASNVPNHMLSTMTQK